MIRAAFAYGLYRFFLFPLADFLFHLAFPFLPKKLKTMVTERQNPNWTPLLAKPVWIHASSGEIEYAKPVITELKRRYPELPVLVTYFSPSASPLIRNFPGVDMTVPLPWDRPCDIKAFLDFYKPQAALFARTDVWPTTATVVSKKKIPSLLFAATLSLGSKRAGFGRSSLSRWAFSNLSQIFCVSDEDRRNFATISKSLPVSVAGDSRFDQVFHRLEQSSRLPSTLTPNASDFVLVAGSTWPEDEEVLLPAFKDLASAGLRLILVPHEVDDLHLRSLEEDLAGLGLSSTRFSRTKTWSAGDVLLVDQVGLLADFYRWGSVAFVGGSFKEKVHSVMEPLAAGLPVLVGPFHTNNREAIQFQGVRLGSGFTAVRMVENANEFRDLVLAMRSKGVSKAEIAQITRSKTGASSKVVDWIESQIKL